MTADDTPETVAAPATLLVREVWSRGDLALVDELVTGDVVFRFPTVSGPVRGSVALERSVAACRRASPDLTRDIEETVVDGETVVIRYTATGSHQGPILGVEPTGRRFEVGGVLVGHVADGKLVEGTDFWDTLGLLRQLDALPESLADHGDTEQQ